MKRPVLIQKFGGSSLSEPSQIQAIARQVQKLHSGGFAVVVVVSAMGKTTDQLLDLAYKISNRPNRRELDMLLSTGERVSMALMSMALNDSGCQSISFTGSQAGVLTDESHSNARIIDIKPVRVDLELAKGHVVVLAGFQGVSPRTKEITTLGRGGSDVTAVAMAAHFKAERCEIRKDVDGVYSCDPNLTRADTALASATHLPHLHYRQLLEMSFFGAKVLHYRSVELAHVMSMPILVGLSHGEGRTTLIDGEGPMFEQAHILSVNSHKDVRFVRVNKLTLVEALKEMQVAIQAAGLPWPQILDTEHLTDSIQKDSSRDHWRFLISSPTEMLRAIQQALSEIPTIAMDSAEISTVTATCQGSFASHLPEQIASALDEKKIRIQKMLLSPMSITVVIDAKDRERAVTSIHDLRLIPLENRVTS